MARFVTQVADTPQILLIAENSWLQTQIQTLFKRHEMHVELITPQQALQQPDVLGDEWYRVVVLVGWELDVDSDSQLSEDQYLRLFHLLSPGSQNVVVVSRSETLPESGQQSQLWYKSAHQLEQINAALLHQVSEARIILGHDVVNQDEGWLFGAFSSQSLFDSLLLSCQGCMYPQLAEEFVRRLGVVLLQPHSSESILWAGEARTITDSVAEILRQYSRIHGTTLVQKTLQQSTQLPDLSVEMVEFAGTDIPSLVTPFVQRLPSPEFARKSRSASEKPVASQQSTVKASSEVVGKRTLQRQGGVVRTTPSPRKSPPTPPPREKLVVTPPKQEVAIQEKVENNLGKLEKQLQSVFGSSRVQHTKQRLSSSLTTTKKIKRKQHKNKGVFILGVGIVGMGLGMVFLSGLFFINQVLLQRALTTTLLSEPDVTAQSSEFSLGSIPTLSSLLEQQVRAYQLLVPSSFLQTATSLVEVGQELDEVEDGLYTLSLEQFDYAQRLLGRSGQQDKTSNTPSPQMLYQQLSRVQTRLEDSASLLGLESEQNTAFFRHLQELREGLISYQQLQPILGDVLAFDDRRTYAILVQNDQELRATGGFIQGVVVVSIESGEIINTQTLSSYELDQFAVGQVAPPGDLEAVLGEQQLFFRDANWSPDFPTSSNQARFFLEQYTKGHIDGVLAINTSFFEAMLEVTGPLELEAYNEVLTHKNIRERLEFHSEVSLLGDQSTKEYPVVVTQALVTRLLGVSPELLPEVLDALYAQLQQKQLFISLADQGEQSSMSLLGWSGELVQPDCPTRLSSLPCSVDTLAAVDSNVGINKANYHLERSDSHAIELSPTRATHTRSITLTNTSASNAWPQGPYNSYLRLVLPRGAQVQSVLLNGSPAPTSALRDASSSTQSILGISSATPISSTTTIEVVYVVPLVARDQSNPGFSYAFFNQLQPGVGQPLTEVKITHPASMSPTLIAPQARVVSDTIIFDEFEMDHVFLGASFR